MRQITSDLADVQLVRSPRARVTVTVEERGQNLHAPALAWSELVSNSGQTVFYPTAAVGLASGTIQKFVAEAGALNRYTVANPHLAASWSVSPTTLVAATMLSVAAVRVPGGDTIRLFYINASNNVQYIESANNGVTFGGATTVYSGGDAVLDLCCAYIDGSTNGPWWFGFTTQSAGVYTPRFGYYNGSSWVTTAYGDTHWRAAGIDAHSSAACRVLLTRTRGQGAGRIRRAIFSASGYTADENIDQTQGGLFGLEICHARYFQLPEAGTCLGLVGESALGAGVHVGVSGAWVQPATAYLCDEPIVLAEVVATNSQGHACLASVGDDVYLVGDTVVWRGAAQAATSETLTPVKYVYDDNQLEIEFEAGIPALYVGQVLVVVRSLSWNTQSGSETFRAIIVRVEQGTDRVTVVALDALGWLGTARCRRPSILNDGTATGVASVMRRLVARFGMELVRDNSALESAAVMPFTLAPAESLAGAAFRVGSQSEFYLVPSNDGSFGLTMITPGTSDSGDYDDTAHEYGQSGNQQPVARAAIISDYRVLAFAYVLGTRSTDPEDGAALAMASGPVVDNTRPLSYSITNSRYNTTARVSNAASAEGARQRKLPITALIEGQVNLALELYDVVEVTEPRLGWVAEQFRVRRIAERYDRGRLTQRAYLGVV